MIQLAHGCYCTELKVYPSNWNTERASLRKDWYIFYRYYAPSISEKGKLRIVKGGINKLKTREQRQLAVRQLLEAEMQLLVHERYNPITGNIMPPESVHEIDPQTPLNCALERALEKLECVHETKLDARSVVKYFTIAAREINYDNMPVREVRAKHITVVLDYMKQNNISSEDAQGNKKPFTNEKYNRYRAYLVMLFKVLKRLGAVDANYATEVEKKKRTKKIRETLTRAQRRIIDRHLAKENPAFRRFAQIFFHSGGREVELLSLQGRHVDLKRQIYVCLVKKGREYRWVERTIKDIALPFWQEAMEGCNPNDFVFSVGLRPGPRPIRREQISRRWKVWVKDPLGITADFYALKHSNTSEVVDQLGAEDAARLNAHTTTAMVVNIYDVKRKERQHERIKKVNNSFA